MAVFSNSVRVFTFTSRDTWGRPVRRIDHNAVAVVVLAAAIGAGLLVFHPYVVGGAKLAGRLMQ
jgi:hypothetical protein